MGKFYVASSGSINIDIMSLTETWLTRYINSRELCDKSFSVFRRVCGLILTL